MAMNSSFPYLTCVNADASKQAATANVSQDEGEAETTECVGRIAADDPTEVDVE